MSLNNININAPKINLQSTNSASNSAKKEELTAAGVNILTKDAKKEVTGDKNSASTAKTTVKKSSSVKDAVKQVVNPNQQASSSDTPKGTEIADASNNSRSYAKLN